jgi:hypothetical protein
VQLHAGLSGEPVTGPDDRHERLVPQDLVLELAALDRRKDRTYGHNWTIFIKYKQNATVSIL